LLGFGGILIEVFGNCAVSWVNLLKALPFLFIHPVSLKLSHIPLLGEYLILQELQELFGVFCKPKQSEAA